MSNCWKPCSWDYSYEVLALMKLSFLWEKKKMIVNKCVTRKNIRELCLPQRYLKHVVLLIVMGRVLSVCDHIGLFWHLGIWSPSQLRCNQEDKYNGRRNSQCKDPKAGSTWFVTGKKKKKKPVWLQHCRQEGSGRGEFGKISRDQTTWVLSKEFILRTIGHYRGFSLGMWQRRAGVKCVTSGANLSGCRTQLCHFLAVWYGQITSLLCVSVSPF